MGVANIWAVGALYLRVTCAQRWNAAQLMRKSTPRRLRGVPDASSTRPRDYRRRRESAALAAFGTGACARGFVTHPLQ